MDFVMLLKPSIIKFIFIPLTFISSTVYATGCTQSNNKIGLVGVDHTNGTIYAGVSQHNNGCSCSSVRFTPANADEKSVLSVLLAAKLAEKKVRIDLKDNNNCNSAYRVYIH